MWWIRNDDIRKVLQPILRSWYQIEDGDFECLMNNLEQKGLLGGDRGPNPYLQLSFDEEKLNEIVQHEIVDKIKNGELVIQELHELDDCPESEWILKEYSTGLGKFKRWTCKHCERPRSQVPVKYCGVCGYFMKNHLEVENEEGEREGGADNG